MKTKKLDLKSLRNEEHFQFGADVIALVRKTGAALLRVEPQLAALEAMHADEDAVLERIRRSALTAKIDDADAARDEIFHGLRESVTAATRHYTPAAREAAGRLQIVFDTYGDLARRNYAEETAAVGNLLAELAGEKYAADCEALGLGGWIGEL
ncbi:MAG: DUF6261 family protein, partial [Alistipes sp.]|nr:DUF6261 family protein [Alistipes sp.]